MAIVGGTTGVVVVGAGQHNAVIDVNAYEWSMSIDNDIFSVGTFGTTGGKVSFKGHYVGDGQVRGYHDDTLKPTTADFAADSTLSTFILTAATGRTYTFTAHVYGVSIAAGVDSGPATIDFRFRTSGDVTVA